LKPINNLSSLVLALLFLALSGSLLAGTISSPTGIVGTADWSDGFTVTSNVTLFDTYARYEYTFEADRKGISHLILSLSANCADDPTCVYDVEGADTDYEVKLYTEGPSNPGLPDGGLFGIKFDGTGDTLLSFSFSSSRMPDYQSDFYAKDGKSGGQDVYAYNSGLVGGTAYIVAPDTVIVAAPEPSTLAISGLAVIGLASIRKWRISRQA
jgi:hypothetical protein